MEDRTSRRRMLFLYEWMMETRTCFPDVDQNLSVEDVLDENRYWGIRGDISDRHRFGAFPNVHYHAKIEKQMLAV